MTIVVVTVATVGRMSLIRFFGLAEQINRRLVEGGERGRGSEVTRKIGLRLLLLRLFEVV
jgi:hypothetical protein